jgi:hypothetical protein
MTGVTLPMVLREALALGASLNTDPEYGVLLEHLAILVDKEPERALSSGYYLNAQGRIIVCGGLTAKDYMTSTWSALLVWPHHYCRTSPNQENT